MFQKGDVVLVSMSERSGDGLQTKRRPAVIISSKGIDQAMVVPLTSNTVQKGGAVFLKKNSSEGKVGGLKMDSSVDCTVIATIPTAMIVSKIGQLPNETMIQIDECIKDQLDENSPGG